MNSSRNECSPWTDLQDHFLLFNHRTDVNEGDDDEEKDFSQEKRSIEEELELIRREREHLLQEHHTSRQQPPITSISFLLSVVVRMTFSSSRFELPRPRSNNTFHLLLFFVLESM